jgi:hypothetical protein
MSSYNGEKYRKHINARDIADRLLLNFDINEVLLWPPNLFALTSSILSLTSAYQLVISPPRGKGWPPKAKEISEWFIDLDSKAKHWLEEIKTRWHIDKAAGKSENVEDVFSAERMEAALSQSISTGDEILQQLLLSQTEISWGDFVRSAGKAWTKNLVDLDPDVCQLINGENVAADAEAERARVLLNVIAKKTPVSVLACWLVLYPLLGEETSVSHLMCNTLAVDDPNLNKCWSAAQAIITLHAIADEACIGWGIHLGGTPEERTRFGGNALEFAERMLLKDGTMSTIGNERCRVLPKRHNPNVGITLRSLSSNLAFHRSSIDVVWRQDTGSPLSKKLNEKMPLNPSPEKMPIIISALLLPWPMQIRTSDFKPYREHKDGKSLPIELDQTKYDFFFYAPDPKKPGFTPDDVTEMVDAAERDCDQVSMLIMPESAIPQESMFVLEATLAYRARRDPRHAVSVIIAGVRDEPPGSTFARNAVQCRTIVAPPLASSFTYTEVQDGDRTSADRVQYKHHRWKLNDSQIRQYGLSAVLDTSKEWWEAIKVERRRVTFINLGDKLTVCPLICEDLARQDPISDLIRHVGPTLVVTILMDGPQKTDRWSSRYAGVLSEDPGSAVLTLSCYGMVRRWNSPYRQMSNVVALWNDGGGPAENSN